VSSPPAAPRLLAYGVFALPLAMLSLPVYVHMPKFYQETFGVNLAALGLLLLLTRLADAALDPWLGYWSDRAQARGHARLRWTGFALPLLMLGLWAMFVPPDVAPAAAALWLAASSLVVYCSLSMVQINYQVHGAEMVSAPDQLTRVTAWREAFTLCGILLGASLPAILAADTAPRSAFASLALIIVGLLAVCCGVTLAFSPKAPAATRQNAPDSWRAALRRPLRQQAFRRLGLVFVINGTAAAIPATLVLFFVQDVLGLAHLTAHFLVVYFAAGALAMPLWPSLARRWGKARTWRLSMWLASGVFMWAALLGPGEAATFFVICALSGLALGGDLALPPALLAELITQQDQDGKTGSPAGAFFGWWALLTKLNLALAAGLALPLVTWLGYRPSTEGSVAAGTFALTGCYALLPCALKLLAAWLLGRPETACKE